MKTLNILALAFLAFGTVACHPALFDDISNADVTVEENGDIEYDGNIITVKKGTPVNFNLAGSPDFITFFSGELGHQYAYRNRMETNLDDVVSSKLKFRVWAQYGVVRQGEENSMKDQMQILYVTENEDKTPVFPGLSYDFEKDSVMVEKEIAWQELVHASQMPTVVNSNGVKSIEVDLTSYKDKKFTMAMVLNRGQKEAPANSTAEGKTLVQSTWHFEDMCIETTWKNGRVTNQYAGAFGFTPVNMKNKTVFDDHSDNVYQMPSDMEYGAVKAGVEGYWNFNNIASGNIDISGAAENKLWKYSWLVSDYLNFASTVESDQGVKIKDINLPVDSYSHTYDRVGTYKATFLMTNENYDDAQQKVVEFVINVKESL